MKKYRAKCTGVIDGEVRSFGSEFELKEDDAKWYIEQKMVEVFEEETKKENDKK